MLDQVPIARPRVALVYGDADVAGHLRNAVAGHVQIVYATSAAEFDAARLAESRATAALLNLDSCEWLDAVETRLHAAGVAVVYNDPEISRALQGWEQARWLRHLTAKLSGSTDFDPPRPVSVEPARVVEGPALATGDTQPVDVAAEPAPLPADAEPFAAVPAAVVEQPLSPAEIASMTVNFSAIPEPAQVPADPLQVADADVSAATGAEPAGAVAAPDADVPAAGLDGDGALDVDTEALSALIDARLAEAEDHASGEAPQVWRVAHGGAVSAVELSPAAEPEMDKSAHAAPDADATAQVLPMDDSELMQGLPAIDDWQLVDRDAPLAPAAPGEQKPRGEPEISIDFAGLELVPIEPVAQAEIQAEPAGRWMHAGNGDAHAAGKRKQPAAPGAAGGHA